MTRTMKAAEPSPEAEALACFWAAFRPQTRVEPATIESGGSGVADDRSPLSGSATSFWRDDEAGPLPWQRKAWRRLMPLLNEARNTAVLLTGPAGLGKASLARAAVASLSCLAVQRAYDGGLQGSVWRENDSARSRGADLDTRLSREPMWPCGQCERCESLQAVRCQDVLTLLPSGRTREHSVEAIREISRFLSLTSKAGRTVLLVDAERMNRNAANALLKTLEEPPAGARLLLTSSEAMRLPATIRSRCVRVELAPPNATSLAALRGQSIDDPDFLAAWFIGLGAPKVLLSDRWHEDETSDGPPHVKARSDDRRRRRDERAGGQLSGGAAKRVGDPLAEEPVAKERLALQLLIDAALSGGAALGAAARALAGGDTQRQLQRVRTLLYAVAFVLLTRPTANQAWHRASDGVVDEPSSEATQSSSERGDPESHGNLINADLRVASDSAHAIWVMSFRHALGAERLAAFTEALAASEVLMLIDESTQWLRDADAPLVNELRWDAIVNAFHSAVRSSRTQT